MQFFLAALVAAFFAAFYCKRMVGGTSALTFKGFLLLNSGLFNISPCFVQSLVHTLAQTGSSLKRRWRNRTLQQRCVCVGAWDGCTSFTLFLWHSNSCLKSGPSDQDTLEACLQPLRFVSQTELCAADSMLSRVGSLSINIETTGRAKTTAACVHAQQFIHISDEAPAEHPSLHCGLGEKAPPCLSPQYSLLCWNWNFDSCPVLLLIHMCIQTSTPKPILHTLASWKLVGRQSAGEQQIY